MDAAQYDKLWDSIKRSPFGPTYVDELHALAKQVVTLAEDVFRAAPKPTEPADRLQVDHDIMRNLFTLLGSAARISALIGERPKRRSQTQLDYEIQRRRAGWLRNDVLKGIKLTRLFEAKSCPAVAPCSVSPWSRKCRTSTSSACLSRRSVCS